MRYPGKPTEGDPSWYRPRPSPIEDSFSEAAKELADSIEAERWFGDSNKHFRFRVDFFLKDVRLIVELDGYEYHHTKDQLTNDAKRQRYLTRAGYTVIRFTGREIYNNVDACVDEVRTIYQERLQRRPVRRRVLYVDYRFCMRQAGQAIRAAQELNPGRSIEVPEFESVVLAALDWLHEKSHVTVFVFVDPDEREEVVHLDGQTFEYDKGEFRITIVCAEFWLVELTEHLEGYSHLYDGISLVGDDLAYVPPFDGVLTNEDSKLIRRNNQDTAYRGTGLVGVPWQDIHYVICGAAGLRLHEM